jgi:hypothetical protein
LAGTPTPEKQYRRAVLGGLVRQYGPDDPRVAEARQALAFTNLADHVAAVVAGFPAPTDEQIDHIVGLLRSGPGSGA